MESKKRKFIRYAGYIAGYLSLAALMVFAAILVNAASVESQSEEYSLEAGFEGVMYLDESSGAFVTLTPGPMCLADAASALAGLYDASEAEASWDCTCNWRLCLPPPRIGCDPGEYGWVIHESSAKGDCMPSSICKDFYGDKLCSQCLFGYGDYEHFPGDRTECRFPWGCLQATSSPEPTRTPGPSKTPGPSSTPTVQPTPTVQATSTSPGGPTGPKPTEEGEDEGWECPRLVDTVEQEESSVEVDIVRFSVNSRGDVWQTWNFTDELEGVSSQGGTGPSGCWYVFSHTTSEGKSDLWIVSTDGTYLVRLTETGCAADPVWDQASDKIFYRNVCDEGNVYWTNKDGKEGPRVTTGGDFLSITWDGRRLYYTREGQAMVYDMVEKKEYPLPWEARVVWHPEGVVQDIIVEEEISRLNIMTGELSKLTEGSYIGHELRAGAENPFDLLEREGDIYLLFLDGSTIEAKSDNRWDDWDNEKDQREVRRWVHANDRVFDSVHMDMEEYVGLLASYGISAATGTPKPIATATLLPTGTASPTGTATKTATKISTPTDTATVVAAVSTPQRGGINGAFMSLNEWAGRNEKGLRIYFYVALGLCLVAGGYIVNRFRQA